MAVAFGVPAIVRKPLRSPCLLEIKASTAGPCQRQTSGSPYLGDRYPGAEPLLWAIVPPARLPAWSACAAALVPQPASRCTSSRAGRDLSPALRAGFGVGFAGAVVVPAGKHLACTGRPV